MFKKRHAVSATFDDEIQLVKTKLFDYITFQSGFYSIFFLLKCVETCQSEYFGRVLNDTV